MTKVWTHSICRTCWDTRNSIYEPLVLTRPVGEICCLCGTETQTDIYLRIDPDDPKLVCRGEHNVE